MSGEQTSEKGASKSVGTGEGSASGPSDYDWHNVADRLPEMPVIVWVSCGGGTALLARYDRYRWESATTIRSLPFAPIWWQHLRLPEPPPNKPDLQRAAERNRHPSDE